MAPFQGDTPLFSRGGCGIPVEATMSACQKSQWQVVTRLGGLCVGHAADMVTVGLWLVTFSSF